MAEIELLLANLESVRPRGQNQWSARCPAHDDRSPSLSVRDMTDGRILIHCFAACTPLDVLAAIGMTMEQLMPEGGANNFAAPPWARYSVKKSNDERADARAVMYAFTVARADGHSLSRKELERERWAWRVLRRHGDLPEAML